jgi:hypothetical protein
MAMKGLLADINIQGQVELLRIVLESASRRELWGSLAVPIRTFAEVGLPREASDRTIWRLCQERELILLTANRNKQGEDSLEAVLQAENTPQSLPVFTLADAEAMRHSKTYAERVAAQALEYLFTIDQLRGTGRLYLP